MRSVVVTGLVFCAHPGGCDYPATCAVTAGDDEHDVVDARCDGHAHDMLASDVETVLAVALGGELTS